VISSNTYCTNNKEEAKHREIMIFEGGGRRRKSLGMWDYPR
jgi:hypothetical protein